VQGGTQPSCVLVRFTGIAFIMGANDYLQLAAGLDGPAPGNPPSAYFKPDNGGGRTISAEFFFADVAVGKHSIQIYFTSPQGGQVEIDEHLTIVQSAP
jgi:hypothetical protein